MFAKKISDLGLYGFGQQRARAPPQDFGELIVKASRLNQLLSLDTAYRSFGREVEASSTPTICRLSDSCRHQLSTIAPGAAGMACRREPKSPRSAEGISPAEAIHRHGRTNQRGTTNERVGRAQCPAVHRSPQRE